MSPLTPQQTQTLAHRLVEREVELTVEVQTANLMNRQRRNQRTHEVTDREEDANDEVAVEVAQAELERDLMELQQISAARARLSEGRYGWCLSCHEPIGLQRLLAQPAATRCMACQSSHEVQNR